MLKRRIIPKLQVLPDPNDMRELVLVYTVGFNDIIAVGSPVSQAKIFQAQMADELILIDLGAGKKRHGPNMDVIRRAAGEIFMPVTVGGGISTIGDFRTALMNGADKISINTAAVEDPTLISRAADVFGSQCVVLSVDYRKDRNGTYSVWTNGGSIDRGMAPIAWCIEGEKRGAGEILLTSIDRDGSRRGLDLELTRQVVESVSIPVITSGGCGMASHFVDGFKSGGADAVAAGTYFFMKDENFMQVRAQVNNAGIPIRIHT